MSTEPVVAALLRQDFGFFLRFAYREVAGDGDYAHNWHIDAIIHQLERVRTGQNLRLIVTMPPRHLKSLTISAAWTAWLLGHNPALRLITVSYSYDLAEKLARDCLHIIDSAWFKLAFPNFRLSKRSVLDFETTDGGGRLSTSLGGVLTGRGADYVIIDDPMKADDALSEAARATATTWLFNTLMSRLNDQRVGAIIMVMQRLHEADMAGEALVRGGWHELRLPAIAEIDERVPVGGNRSYQRRRGCALHPARQPLDVLQRIRAEDSRVFAAQYQQTPVPMEGNYVQPSWFTYYDEPPEGGIILQSWDTASKDGVTHDFSVGITACLYQGRFHILDVFRERLNFHALRMRVIASCRRFNVQRLLIEDAASGTQLIDMLRTMPANGVVRPIPCTPNADKRTRFAAQASRIEAGDVLLPRNAPWLAEFVTEIAGFPNARYDDQADALAQLLRHGDVRQSRLGVGGLHVGPPR